MGQLWSEVCEPKVPGEVPEKVDVPDHPGASRVSYSLMQGYYGSVCKVMRGDVPLGTGWLIRLADLGPAVKQLLQDPEDQAIVTSRQCIPTKEAAGTAVVAIFDYVDEKSTGTRASLDPGKFFFSGGGKSEYVVIALRSNVDLKERKPIKLGMNLTDDELPRGATVTVVSHPRGLPREVSHGHITRVESDTIYYNAGAKAALGSAVFFAHENDLHVIACGLRSSGSDTHEVMGVRVSRFREVTTDELAAKQPAKAVPEPVPQAVPAQIEKTRIENVKEQSVKIANGQTVTYTGQLKVPTNVPHGVGTAVFENGAIHEGDWVHGKRHGASKITKPNEGVYSKGECEDDLFIGTWTKYNIKDDTFLEEHHYDHSTIETMARHWGFWTRKAAPKEESPTKESTQSGK